LNFAYAQFDGAIFKLILDMKQRLKKQNQKQQQEWIRYAHKSFFIASLNLGASFSM
jgi:hypothetical protein